MTSIPFGMPLLAEEEFRAVRNVLESGNLVHGPVSEGFEEDFKGFTGAPNAVSVSSCTAGMHLAYVAIGLGPGDEVLVPAQTHVATAHAVELTGATAVFVDVDSESGNIDLSKIEAGINSRTRAIAVVHFLGVPVRMKQVMEIAERHGLFVVEDCAVALGATLDGKHVGLHGDVGVFSFYPVKHITSAEGGMVISRHKELSDKIRLLRAFGVDRTHSQRDMPGQYDVVDLGFNYRMSEVHAAIGRVQLGRLSGFLDARQRNYQALAESLSGQDNFVLLEQPKNNIVSSGYYAASVVLKGSLGYRRNEVVRALSNKGVGTSVYYPQPVPRMSYYRDKYGYVSGDFQNAATISDNSIALPVGPHVAAADMGFIADALITAVEEI